LKGNNLKSINIAIELPTWMGDAVMASPAIENICNHYRNCEIIFLGSQVATELYSNHPNCKETKVISKSYKELFLFALSFNNIDIFISFRSSFRSSFLKFVINANKKIIYSEDKLNKYHMVEKYNRFINSSLGMNLSAGQINLYTSNFENIKKYDELTIGINPGAAYGSAKRWDLKKFGELAKHFSPDYKIVLFGGNNELDVSKKLENYFKKHNIQNYHNLIGKTSIDELMQRISSLSILITGDSGPMHIAAAFQIPTVAIFGPTDHLETSQWKNKKGLIVRKEIECQPCKKRECPLLHNRCMNEITTQEVIEKVKYLIESGLNKK